MPVRQVAVLLVGLIAIVGAALFVISYGDDDETADVASTTTTTVALTTTTSTTLAPTTTTSIPVACTAGDPAAEGEEDATVEAADEATEEPPADPDIEEDDDPIEPTLGTNSSVTTAGLDEVFFGLTVAQAEAAAGTEMIPCDPVGSCYRVTPRDAPEGISFVVHEGTIERVDIVAGPITTRSGAGIGTTGERLVELFGDQLQRDLLDADTVDLIFVPADESDAEFRVAFTVVDGLVTTFRAGRVPLILEPDPCAA